MISNKTYILFFLLLFTYVNTFAQVKIGDDVSTINATSLLELESTSKVLVLTRVTNAQMLSIMPLKGALVYNIDSKCVHLFNGTLWQNICNSSNNAITITDNNDGSYTLTSSDGTTFTSPNSESLKGENGNDGLSAFQIATNNGFSGTEAQWLASLQGTDGTDGEDGSSAFQIATNNGFSGTEAQWLVSLQGTDGTDGQDGDDGATGTAGTDGDDGLSAFQIATNNGFSGTEAQWLTSLQGTDGTDGQDGDDGLSAFQIATNNGFSGTEAQWIASLEGTDGTDGQDGDDGLSAFQIATNNGFSGTEAQWLASLQGDDGADGADGNDGLSAFQIAINNGFSGTEAQWLVSLEGTDGTDGQDGDDGATGSAGSDGDDGLSAFQIATNNGFSGTEAQWLASLQGDDGADGIDGTTAIVQNLDSPTTDTTLSTSALASYLKTEILTQASAFSTSDILGHDAVDLSIVAHTFNPVISNISGAKYVGEIQWEILETVGIFKNRFAIYVNGTRVTPVLNIWPNVINLTSAPTNRFFEYTSTGSDVIELRMSRSLLSTGVLHVLNAELKLRRSL